MWMLSDEIRNIFQLNIDSIIYRSGLLKIVEIYSKDNNLSVGVEEVDYVLNKLIKDGYLQEIENYTETDNDKIYKIGNDYKTYLKKLREKEKNKLLKEIGNKISQYTVDFCVNLEQALEDIKKFMLSRSN